MSSVLVFDFGSVSSTFIHGLVNDVKQVDNDRFKIDLSSIDIREDVVKQRLAKLLLFFRLAYPRRTKLSLNTVQSTR
jgi:hypothetical protein